MGFLDNVLGSAVPGGSVGKPLILALGALLASGTLFKRSEGSESPPGADFLASSGSPLGGLQALLARFEQSGHGDTVRSWVGTGQNQPISAEQMSQALGPEIVRSLAAKTGLPEDDLASHLSQILPSVVDKLTPNGRIPTAAELVHMG
jgi:uncharacterized protein YidB (DUF937 family)